MSTMKSILAVLALLTCLLDASPTAAQGTVRTQSRDVTPGGDLLPPGGDSGLGGIVDYREEMRRFVQNISAYVRKTKPEFTVLTMNGLELLTKPAEGNETLQYPARTYIRTIDGVIQEGVFYGIPTLEVATVPERRTPLLQRLAVAKESRLRILTIDYAQTPAVIDAATKMARDQGFIPFIAPARPLSQLPPYPARPDQENPKSILSLPDVKNFLYLPESTGFGREDEYAMALHGTNYDMLILDVFHGRAALSRTAIETMKYKKLGARRMVMARVNVGTAEAYRYYWRPEWREGSPRWINAPSPGNPDRYYVAYWQPEWQQIVSGGNQSYLFGILQQGFDGIVLDGVEAYRFFEGTTNQLGSNQQFFDVTP